MSSLSCPICAPQTSADDADFLYYPSDEEIPVSLCKHVYGYPRDLKSKYTFLEDLGRGSFGVVRRVVDTETGSFHACKTIPKSRPTWTGGMDGAQREATTSAYLIKIQQEVNFLARLADVDEVVQLRRAYEDDECVHLVMDLCEGGSLADRMKSSGKGGDEEGARAAMRCVLGMLASCHERGIIYRDVKPQNFLYTRQGEDGELKCSDFGLAMTFIVGEDTRVEKRAGTPVYMAPELVLRRYDERADLWSAGVLMFELVSGRLPLWGGKVPVTSTLDDIFFDTLIREIDFGCLGAGKDAEDLCRGLLCRDPRRRLTARDATGHAWLRG